MLLCMEGFNMLETPYGTLRSFADDHPLFQDGSKSVDTLAELTAQGYAMVYRTAREGTR